MAAEVPIAYRPACAVGYFEQPVAGICGSRAFFGPGDRLFVDLPRPECAGTPPPPAADYLVAVQNSASVIVSVSPSSPARRYPPVPSRERACPAGRTRPEPLAR